MLKTITTDELLAELYRRGQRAASRVVGPTFEEVSQWLRSNCDFGEIYEVKFRDVYGALDFDMSRLQLSRHLKSTYGISLRNGTSNVKYIRGLRLKQPQQTGG